MYPASYIQIFAHLSRLPLLPRRPPCLDEFNRQKHNHIIIHVRDRIETKALWDNSQQNQE